VNKKEEQAKEKAEVTGRVPRRFLDTLSRRPVAKIWVNRWASQQEEEQALSLFLLSFEAECILSKPAPQPPLSRNLKRHRETEKEKEKEREQKSRMHSVEILTGRSHSE
jgi:hypothetical protein